MSNVRPLNDRILIKKTETPEMTSGGIFIPKTLGKDPNQPFAFEAEVLAVGPGKALENGRRRESNVKVGDKVLVGQYLGTEVKVQGEFVTLVKEDDILAVLE